MVPGRSPTSITPSRLSCSQQGLFVKVPLQWGVAASKATKTPKALIWLLLLHLAWRTKDTTFSFSNERATDVCFWHLADIDADDKHVCFWGQSGHRQFAL